MSHQYKTLEDTVFFWFASNNTSGSGDDGASPVFDVRLAGAAAGAIPVLSGSATLLTHANYPDGCHEVAVAATAGNGFAAGNTYAVFCTLLVDSQNPAGFVGSFQLKPVEANILQINDALTDGTPAVGSRPILSLQQLNLDCQIDNEGALHCSNASGIGAGIKTVAAGTDILLTSGTFEDGSGDAIEVQSDLIKIHGTALTETAGLLAGAFSKFFNKATPTGTVNSLPDAVPGASGGLIAGDASGRVDVGSWLGTAAATPTVAGVPEVDMTHINGALTDGSPAVASRPVLSLQQLRLESDVHDEGALHCSSIATVGKGMYCGGNVADIELENGRLFDGSQDPIELYSDLRTIHGTALTETPGQLAAGFKKLFDVTTPLLVASDVMRGTDSAATATALTTHDGKMDTLTTQVGTAGAGLTDLGGMSTGMKAEVNAEVDGALNTAIPGSPTADSINERIKAIDVLTEASGDGDLAAILVDTNSLNDTVIAEITGIGGAPITPTMREALMLVYMWLRNDSAATATERRIKKADGTEVLDATMSDDGTTFSQGTLTGA